MKRILFRSIPFLLIAAVILTLIFYPKPGEEVKADRIVEIWNVDTFEGGRGSRASFLSRIAAEVSGDGLYFRVISCTAEGARAALKEGDLPDMISFGVGLPDFAAKCLPLPYAFYGGEAEGVTLAVPWCMGKYYLFSLEEDPVQEGAYAISDGGENLSAVAAALNGVTGELVSSEEAYVRFLGGEYRYLLGTQRDVCRFEARKVTVFSRELSAYNDLYQCVSVLSSEKREDCMKLVGALTSEETQNRLDEIGMFPPEGGETYTVSVFTSCETLSLLRRSAADGEGRNFLEKYLKSH